MTRRVRFHTARTVNQLQLVRVQIQIVCNTQGHLGRLGGIQQLALRTHRHKLTRRHRQCTRQQTRNTREQDHRAGRARGGNTHSQRQVRHQTVVSTKDRRTEITRKLLATVSRQGANNLLVNRLVSRHFLGSVRILSVGGAGLGALSHRQNKHRTEVLRQELQHQRLHGRAHVNIRVFAEHVTPMLLVALLRLGNLQKDLAVGTLGAASQVAVDACLRLLVGQVAAPTLNLRGGGGGDGAMAGGLRSFGSGVFRLKLLGFFAVLVWGVRAHISLFAGCGLRRVSPGRAIMRSICVF